MRRFIADDQRRVALNAALQEGLDSGPALPFDFDEFMAQMKGRLSDRDTA